MESWDPQRGVPTPGGGLGEDDDPSQRALVLYQHLQGAAWVNAEQLLVEKLSTVDGMQYFREWITQHYLDVEVTQVGRSLSDLFRKLKRKPAQTFRDYVAEYNRLSARVAECGCCLPDVASAWLFVDRANLDESTEVSLLASVGNRYHLQQLQQAAIILDRSMRKPWERVGRTNTVHLTHEVDEDDDDEGEAMLKDELGEEDNGDLYVAYMTAKARYRDATKARGVDVEAVRKTAEQKVATAKARSHCAACGQRGHWHKDAICPKNKTHQATQDHRAHSINVTNEVFELATTIGGPLLAITDTACARSVVGSAWLQRYLDEVKGQNTKDGGKAYSYDLLNEKELFRFGASRVYESSYAAIILTKVGDTWLAIKAAVIHGDIPLLLSKPLLASLGMMFDVANNVASFRTIGVADHKLATTPSGHPALVIRSAGCAIVDPNSVPKAWGDKEIEILKSRGAYISFVVGHGESLLSHPNQYPIDTRLNPRETSSTSLFYAKKIPTAIHEALVADHLHMNTFLAWWNGTATSNDFWIETEHKLIRIHVTPRKTFFCPSKWQTEKTVQRDRLLSALGDVRESWGIACTTQRELSTVVSRWRESDDGGYQVLWIGRSVFNRAVCDRPAATLRHEQSLPGAMEDDEGRAPTRMRSPGDTIPSQMDGARTAARALGTPGQRGVAAAQAPDLDDLGRATAGGGAHRHWVWTPRGEGQPVAADPGCPDTRPDHHDGRALHGGALCGGPGGVWRLGVRGRESEGIQHAPGPSTLCALAPGEEKPGGDQLHGGLPVRRSGDVSPGDTAPDANDESRNTFLGLVSGPRECEGEELLRGSHDPEESTQAGNRGAWRDDEYDGGEPGLRRAVGEAEYPKSIGRGGCYTGRDAARDACGSGGRDPGARDAAGCVERSSWGEPSVKGFPPGGEHEKHHEYHEPEQGHHDTNDAEDIDDVATNDIVRDNTGCDTYDTEDIGDVAANDIVREYINSGDDGNRGAHVDIEPGRHSDGGDFHDCPSGNEEIRHSNNKEEFEPLAHGAEVDAFLTMAINKGAEKGAEACEKAAMEALEDKDFTYETLEEILEMMPTRKERPRKMHAGEDAKNRHVFGYYVYGKFGGICRRTFRYPYLMKYLNEFLGVQVEDDLKEKGQWNAITILRDVPVNVHTDNNNLPHTKNYSVATGAYVGGKVWVQSPGGGVWRDGKGGHRVEGKYVTNYQKAIAIDPKAQHAVEEWEGTRWCLVGYTTRNAYQATPSERKALMQMGFPLPTTPSRTRALDAETFGPRRMPRRSMRKGMWRRAAELSVLFATVTNACRGYAKEICQVEPDCPPMAMQEIGGVTATCYAAEVLNDGVRINEPIMWTDVAMMTERGYLETTGQLWIHVDDESNDKHGSEMIHLAQRQLANGGAVVFENDEPGKCEAWKGLCGRWSPIEYTVVEDTEAGGNPTIRVQSRNREPHQVFVGEVQEEDATKAGAEGITLPKGTPPHVVAALKRAHQNLGHPSTADFVRHLRLAGATQEVLKAARGLVCETCVRTQAPSIAKPAAIGNVLQFNEVVGADLIYVHDVNGLKHELLSIVDFSSSYHLVIPVARKDTATLEQAFCQNWVNIFGAPGTIAVDLENGLQKAFAKISDWTGMAIRSCAGQAHWQAGFTERNGGVWKAIFAKVAEDKNVMKTDMVMAVSAVSHAKNNLRKVSGYSPAQHVFGQTPNLPEDLIDGPMAQLPEGEEVVFDTKHGREVAIRTAARAAFHSVQTDDRVRRALQGRARVRAREPHVGEQVFFFRKAKNSKRGWWRGPATIIGKEANNFWVSRAGRCLLCAPEHVRPATNQELGQIFSLRASRDDMERLLNADYDDENVFMEDEPGEEDEQHERDDAIEEEGIEMENEDVEVEEKGIRREGEPLASTVKKRYRRKEPPQPGDEGRLHEALMLKKARTERSRAKQLEKELPWNLIPEEVREDFRKAEDKQWGEHMQHDALEVLSPAESRRVEEVVDRRRILNSRWAYRDKNLAHRRVRPDTPWKAKARLVIGGHEDPDLSSGAIISDSPTVARSSLILLLQICASLHWEAAAGDVAAAFLNGVYIERELYMRQPRGGVRGLRPDQLLKVKKGCLASLKVHGYGSIV